jgi:hypothetical protein
MTRNASLNVETDVVFMSQTGMNPRLDVPICTEVEICSSTTTSQTRASSLPTGHRLSKPVTA